MMTASVIIKVQIYPPWGSRITQLCLCHVAASSSMPVEWATDTTARSRQAATRTSLHKAQFVTFVVIFAMSRAHHNCVTSWLNWRYAIGLRSC